MMLRSLFLALALLAAAPSALRADVLVFAAASLKEPLDRIAASFDDVVVSYGGSGTLARQVTLGAPADIVLLANEEWMQVLVADNHVRPESVSDFASNRLVVIAPAGVSAIALEPEALAQALGDGRIALGMTNTVPAGIYGKAALQALGLWDVAKDRLAEVDNVRSALGLVARGEAPLGIVYQSDVRVSDAVTLVATFPEDSHPPIRYLGALTADAGPDAAAVLAYLNGPAGQAILAEAGFLPALKVPQ